MLDCVRNGNVRAWQLAPGHNKKVEQTLQIDRKGKTFAATIGIRIRTIFQFLIVLQTAVYTAERFEMPRNFSDLKNPRFIIESGFKSRAGYNGARTVFNRDIYLFNRDSSLFNRDKPLFIIYCCFFCCVPKVQGLHHKKSQ